MIVITMASTPSLNASIRPVSIAPVPRVGEAPPGAPCRGGLDDRWKASTIDQGGAAPARNLHSSDTATLGVLGDVPRRVSVSSKVEDGPRETLRSSRPA